MRAVEADFLHGMDLLLFAFNRSAFNRSISIPKQTNRYFFISLFFILTFRNSMQLACPFYHKLGVFTNMLVSYFVRIIV